MDTSLRCKQVRKSMLPKKCKSCIYNVLIFCNICLEMIIIIMIPCSIKSRLCNQNKSLFTQQIKVLLRVCCFLPESHYRWRLTELLMRLLDTSSISDCCRRVRYQLWASCLLSSTKTDYPAHSQLKLPTWGKVCTLSAFYELLPFFASAVTFTVTWQREGGPNDWSDLMMRGIHPTCHSVKQVNSSQEKNARTLPPLLFAQKDIIALISRSETEALLIHVRRSLRKEGAERERGDSYFLSMWGCSRGATEPHAPCEQLCI